MKKPGTIILILMIITFFWGCKGDEGGVYISFDWVFTPFLFYCDDPNLPGAIYRLEYYGTATGSYYLEYYHNESGEWHWMYYTLTAEEGKIFFADGDDTHYDVGLWAYSEPTMTSYTQAIESLNVSTEKEKAKSEGYIRSEFLDIAPQKREIDLRIYEKKTLSVYEESNGRYKLEVVSGIYILKE